MGSKIKACLAAALALLLAGCAGAAEAPPVSAPVAEPTQPPVGPSPSPASAASATQPPVNAPATPTASGALSIDDATALVRADLAATLGTTADSIALVSSERRVWLGDGLGCQERRGVGDSRPVAGYLIVLSHEGRSYNYHADTTGLFVRCQQPVKPVDPIR